MSSTVSPFRTLWTSLFMASLLLVTAGSLIGPASLPALAFDVWDKAQHTLAFAWLTVCGLMAWPGRQRIPAIAGGLAAWGGLIELLQAAGGQRHGDWADLVADIVGVVAVLIIHRLINRAPRPTP